MNSINFKEIEKICKAALEISPEKRPAYLREICGDNDELLKEVESLLSFDTPSDELINKTPDLLAAEMFSELKQIDFKGTEIDQYEIISQIGKGGMGTVYLARDKSLGRKIAIKFLDKKFSLDQDRLQRFFLEARTASALNHPNIITIFEIGKLDSHHYIVTEFIEGKTLREIIGTELLEIKSVVEIAIQVASALKAAHDAGIIHRDIKPDNIMVRPDGLVKVLDFGVAKLSEQEFEDGISIRIETQQGMIIGTVDYMSPEQAGGEKVDTLTDIFSFGVVLYYVLAGKLPFEGESPSEIMTSILTKEPKSLDEFDENIPVEFIRIVKKALEKEKEKRFQTAQEMLDELKLFKKHLDVSEEIGKSVRSGISKSSLTDMTKGLTADRMRKVETAENPGKIFLQKNVYLRKGLVLGTLFLLLTIIGFIYWYYANDSGQIESIAVLPFINESENKDIEYLTDGMTENLINNLSQIPALSVKSSNTVFRYKGKELSAKKIGEELNVQAVLIGRVIQRGEDLTLNLELVDTSKERVLWGEKYNSKMNNLISLQRDITRTVSDKLRPKLNTEEKGKLAKEYTTNTEAYQAYLRGRFYWNKRDGDNLKKGIEYFQKAIELDPNFALAWSGLADSYALIYNYTDVPRSESAFQSKNAARKAVEIDPYLSEAHTSLANVLQTFDWEFAEAEKHYQKATELNPNYATAFQWYSQLLGQMGKPEEAIKTAKQAVELEPYSKMTHYQLAEQYLYAKRYDEALEQFKKTSELDPDNIAWKVESTFALLQQNKTDEVIEIINEVIAKEGRDAFYLRMLASAYINSGKKEEAEKLLQEILSFKGDDLAQNFDIAVVYARLGEKDKAFEYLNKSFEKKEQEITFLKLSSHLKVCGMTRDLKSF